MSVSDKTPWPNLLIWRCIFFLAMLDALACGLLGTVAPDRLISYLGMTPRNDQWAWQLLVPRDPRPDVGSPQSLIPPPRDAPGLWQLLALIWLAHAVFLALVVWRPRSLRQLVVVPLIGHALGAALWLWALGATYTLPPHRVPFPDRGALVLLAVHHAVWLPLFLAFLILSRPRADRDSQKQAVAVQ